MARRKNYRPKNPNIGSTQLSPEAKAQRTFAEKEALTLEQIRRSLEITQKKNETLDRKFFENLLKEHFSTIVSGQVSFDKFSNASLDFYAKSQEDREQFERWLKDSFDKEQEERRKERKETNRLVTQFKEDFKNIGNQTLEAAKNYLTSTQKLTYWFDDSGVDAKDVFKRLSGVLTMNPMVRLESVSAKLTSLVESGIMTNVEQRAFLEALSEDIGAQFASYQDSINLQNRLYATNIADERLALEVSLKSLLNENFQNSQYIRNSFASVINDLKDTLALSSPGVGLGVEATTQKWLGSLYSVGFTSADNLAQAINALGSGDVSAIGQGMQNLLIAGAARVGQSYADLMNQGLTADSSNRLLQGVINVIADLRQESNINTRALANVFGLSVQDIIAAGNLRESMSGIAGAGLSTDIYSTLLDRYDEYVPINRQYSNLLSNLTQGAGMFLASNPLAFLLANVAPALGDLAGTAFQGPLEGVGNVLSDISDYLPFLIGLGGSALTNSEKGLVDSLFTMGRGFFSTIGEMISTGVGLSLPYHTTSGLYSLLGQGGSNVISRQSFTFEGEPIEITEKRDVNDIYNLLESGQTPVMLEPTSIVATDTVNLLSGITEYTLATAIYSRNIYEMLKVKWDSTLEEEQRIAETRTFDFIGWNEGLEYNHGL